MQTNESHDTPPVRSTQRPAANLRQAIEALSRYPAFTSLRDNQPVTHPPQVLVDFVIDLIETYPELVMAEVVRRRNKELADALGEYRGEV